MFSTMGGPSGTGNRTEVRARVVLACAPARRSCELDEALADAGFDVSCAGGFGDDLDRMLELADGSTLVLVLLDDEDDDWLRLVADLVRRFPTARPLALVDLPGPDDFLAAIGAGVAGFTAPDASVDAIVRTATSIAEQGVAIPRSMVSALVDEVRHGRGHSVRTAAGTIVVTDREWEILQLLLQRRSTREMADRLYVSVGTVRSHVSTLLKKLGAVDRDDAIRLIERSQR